MNTFLFDNRPNAIALDKMRQFQQMRVNYLYIQRYHHEVLKRVNLEDAIDIMKRTERKVMKAAA